MKKLNCFLNNLTDKNLKVLKNVNCKVFRTLSIIDNNFLFGKCDLFIGQDYVFLLPFNNFPIKEFKLPILLTNNINFFNPNTCNIRVFKLKNVTNLSQEKTVFFSENEVSVEFESNRLMKSDITITFNYLNKENAELLTELKNWC